MRRLILLSHLSVGYKVTASSCIIKMVVASYLQCRHESGMNFLIQLSDRKQIKIQLIL